MLKHNCINLFAVKTQCQQILQRYQHECLLLKHIVKKSSSITSMNAKTQRQEILHHHPSVDISDSLRHPPSSTPTFIIVSGCHPS
ncbi:hypothetical protein HanRHA438_Chr02g0088351 [Helianthus annuus]|nr:hypothetical protein HanRHA438_Chr02g0088351 [Helianthus annuus]